jgi:hypothetical protein
MIPFEYSLVRFSPSPEEIEPVNVGVVLWDVPPRLLIEEQFPRLGCVAGDAFDPELLRFYLADLHDRLATAYPDSARMATNTSQIQVSPKREVRLRSVDDVESLLRKKYLQRPTVSRDDAANTHSEYIDSVLHDFLTRQLHLPSRDLLRRAQPGDYLPPEIVHRHFSGDEGRVARVLVGRQHILAIDGVNRGVRIGEAERRAIRIGRTFFCLGRAKEDLHRLQRKTLHRAAVFFGQAREQDSGRAEYLEASLKRDAEFAMDVTSPSAPFVQLAKQAAADLFL